LEVVVKETHENKRASTFLHAHARRGEEMAQQKSRASESLRDEVMREE
jgi:hypothetical protein